MPLPYKEAYTCLSPAYAFESDILGIPGVLCSNHTQHLQQFSIPMCMSVSEKEFPSSLVCKCVCVSVSSALP